MIPSPSPQAKVLMKGVDDITLGMGGAADTLFLSAKSGDEGLQMEQTKAIKNFASSLQAIANEAVEGYGHYNNIIAISTFLIFWCLCIPSAVITKRKSEWCVWWLGGWTNCPHNLWSVQAQWLKLWRGEERRGRKREERREDQAKLSRKILRFCDVIGHHRSVFS